MDITPARPFFHQQGLRQKRICEKSSLVFLIFRDLVPHGFILDNNMMLKIQIFFIQILFYYLNTNQCDFGIWNYD